MKPYSWNNTKRQLKTYTVEVQVAVRIPKRDKPEMISRYFDVDAYSKTHAINSVKRAGYSKIIKVTEKK